jgi:DNA-binding transcriptional LysR family regulator
VLFSTTELQILAALAAGLTLAQIGEDLALSHSSISKALGAIERKSGLRLLEHTGRRLRLTSSGMDLAHSARAAVDELLDVERTVDALRKGTIGKRSSADRPDSGGVAHAAPGRALPQGGTGRTTDSAHRSRRRVDPIRT